MAKVTAWPLGAQVADVLRIVLSRGLKIAAGGVGVGLAGAAVLGRSMSALLYGVRPVDPAFLAAAAALGMVAPIPLRI